MGPDQICTTRSTMSDSHFFKNNTHSDCKTLNTLVYIRHRSISRCHLLAIPKHWLSNEPIGSTQPSDAQTHDCLIVDTPIRFKHNTNAAGEFTWIQPKWKESEEEEWGWGGDPRRRRRLRQQHEYVEVCIVHFSTVMLQTAHVTFIM